jgi:hypothetical protein
MNTQVFSVYKLGGKDVLAGAQNGRSVLAKLISTTSPTGGPAVAFLDFQKVAVATSSFLRESVLGFRDYARTALPTLYPVVANASDVVSEELELFMKKTGDAIWCCDLDRTQRVSRPRVLGVLDPAEKQTFELVSHLGGASAPELGAKRSDLKLTANAWNNRLASLASKGLLVESRDGKAKFFTPVLRIA